LFPYSVPANNEFVIQNVSMAFSYSGALDGPPTVATLNVTQGGQPATNNFPILQQMNQGTLTQNLAINQQVTLYADPGTYSTCTMTTLTGYLAGGNFSCGNAR
jgi:hypothetical protein